MTSLSYERPPITEAVIGITFETPLSDEELFTIQAKFSATYPQHQSLPNLNLKIAVDVGADNKKKATTAVDEEMGHRRSTHDMTELLVVLPTSLLMSQLAPYPGWDEFFGRFVRDWKLWKRHSGFRQVKHVGVRYINRIDIPVSAPIVEHKSYLNVYPQLPNFLGPLNAYGVQAMYQLADIGCALTLNSAVVPSPLLDHASFVIDLDISKSIDPPQNDEEIYKLLEVIRNKKNDIFESCITEKARGLFSNDKQKE